MRKSRFTEAQIIGMILGEDALGLVAQKHDDMRGDVTRWEVLSQSTGFDAY